MRRLERSELTAMARRMLALPVLTLRHNWGCKVTELQSCTHHALASVAAHTLRTQARLTSPARRPDGVDLLLQTSARQAARDSAPHSAHSVLGSRSLACPL